VQVRYAGFMSDLQAPVFEYPTRLVTVEELAELLGLNRQTLYQWRVLGKGPRGIRVGGRVRYRQAEVEAWLQEHESP
jgi:excisionase family DNA binding protein